jgi:hypothetical protein
MALALGVALAGAPIASLAASAQDANATPAPPPDGVNAFNAWMAAAALPDDPKGQRPDGVAQQLSDWVASTDDNGALPFLVVDKLGAHVFAFDSAGDFLGSAPVLLGLARGDDSAPGIGQMKFSQISADERTTPAGRFVAQFGPSRGHGKMLWVDLPDAISLHPVMSVDAGEHRLQRIKSQDPGRHRISYGCINVPASFYHGVVLKALNGGAAIVYVLPDTKTVEEVFPAFGAIMGGGQPDTDPPYAQVSRAERTASEAAMASNDVALPPPTDFP